MTDIPSAPPANLSEMTDDERAGEVFAHYGLAMYESQVLEHGLANALMVIEFILRAKTFRDFDEWAASYDDYLETELGRTFGGLVTCILKNQGLPDELRGALEEAKQARNFLAHRFFRDNAERFFFLQGQQSMVAYCDDALTNFGRADRLLEDTVRPLREKYGLTDDWLKGKMDEEMNRLLSMEEERLKSEVPNG